jgi:hypothetical protein
VAKNIKAAEAAAQTAVAEAPTPAPVAEPVIPGRQRVSKLVAELIDGNVEKALVKAYPMMAQFNTVNFTDFHWETAKKTGNDYLVGEIKLQYRVAKPGNDTTELVKRECSMRFKLVEVGKDKDDQPKYHIMPYSENRNGKWYDAFKEFGGPHYKGLEYGVHAEEIRSMLTFLFTLRSKVKVPPAKEVVASS